MNKRATYAFVFTRESNAEGFASQWVDATGSAFHFLVWFRCHVDNWAGFGLG